MLNNLTALFTRDTLNHSEANISLKQKAVQKQARESAVNCCFTGFGNHLQLLVLWLIINDDDNLETRH